MIGFDGLFQPQASKVPVNKFRLYMAKLSDCNVESWPSAVDGIMQTSPLKPGREWFYLDGRPQSIDPAVVKDNEDDIEGYVTISPVIEGLTEEAIKWIYAHNGVHVIAVWVRCSDGKMFVAGSPCSGGLRLTYTQIGKLDDGELGASLSLRGGKCAEPIYFATFSLDPVPEPEPTYYTLTVIDKYVEEDGSESSVTREPLSLKEGSSYSAAAHTIEGYDVVGPKTYSGRIKHDTTVTFVYQKQSAVLPECLVTLNGFNTYYQENIYDNTGEEPTYLAFNFHQTDNDRGVSIEINEPGALGWQLKLVPNILIDGQIAVGFGVVIPIEFYDNKTIHISLRLKAPQTKIYNANGDYLGEFDVNGGILVVDQNVRTADSTAVGPDIESMWMVYRGGYMLDTNDCITNREGFSLESFTVNVVE